MKNTLFLAIFLGLLAFPTLNRAEAQVVEAPATSSQIDALQATLIQLLTDLIAQLQAQIAEILAEQAKTQVQVGVSSEEIISLDKCQLAKG